VVSGYLGPSAGGSSDTCFDSYCDTQFIGLNGIDGTSDATTISAWPQPFDEIASVDRRFYRELHTSPRRYRGPIVDERHIASGGEVRLVWPQLAPGPYVLTIMDRHQVPDEGDQAAQG
jgi:hypothetical protein